MLHRSWNGDNELACLFDRLISVEMSLSCFCRLSCLRCINTPVVGLVFLKMVVAVGVVAALLETPDDTSKEFFRWSGLDVIKQRDRVRDSLHEPFQALH
jgi:hypothetical protein